MTIREYVFKYNITYTELAKRLNISTSYLYNLSEGKRKYISEKLANKFKEVAPEIDIKKETRVYFKI